MVQKTFLHVGCGPKRKESTTADFSLPQWSEVRYDIDPEVEPDIVGTMTDLSEIADGTFDALYSSHNLEHLYAHEVGLAVHEFRRVLKPDGFAVITCPDLQSICEEIVAGGLTHPIYESAAGPITPFDMLFGHRGFIAAGNGYMAHRSGFTEKALTQVLQAAGFAGIASKRRPKPRCDLWFAAVSAPGTETDIRGLASLHFPNDGSPGLDPSPS